MTEKRLRCRASVLRPTEFRSHQCMKAATGTANLWRRGERITLAACTVHQRGPQVAFDSDPKDRWVPRIEEYMR